MTLERHLALTSLEPDPHYWPPRTTAEDSKHWLAWRDAMTKFRREDRMGDERALFQFGLTACRLGPPVQRRMTGTLFENSTGILVRAPSSDLSDGELVLVRAMGASDRYDRERPARVKRYEQNDHRIVAWIMPTMGYADFMLAWSDDELQGDERSVVIGQRTHY